MHAAPLMNNQATYAQNILLPECTWKEPVANDEGDNDAVLQQLLGEARLVPGQASYAIARRGAEALISHALADYTHESDQAPVVDKVLVDVMIAEIDRRLSAQVNAILHHETFQARESAWRELKFLVDRVNFRENIEVDILSVSKDELQQDFDDAPETVQSGLYQLAYNDEYGVFGGRPYGALVASYDFGPGSRDMALLQQCASVATMAHAPFVANAGADFFGQEDHTTLGHIKDLQSHFEGPEHIKWRSFRESSDAAHVGLCMPRFLLRQPYGADSAPVKGFQFTESLDNGHRDYLWGHASVAFASRLASSFAAYRWCPNIVGPASGGTVEDLPLHQYESMGVVQTQIPTETLITERREYELAEAGFIPLTYRKASDNACFFSASSAQKPQTFGNSPEGKQAETNARLGAQLPYMFVISRLAHYIKVLQREQLGAWKERSDLEREINRWLSQYVADMEDPAPGVRSKRPLRKAHVEVHEVEGEPGWYGCNIKVQPHMKYMGASFTLSLVGRLEQAS